MSIIGNFKSIEDKQAKKNLQQSLLDLEISNEAEREKRQKDYKNPNKPAPVAPQFKSNAELQKDRIAQEAQAIANMNELGFDYQKGAELTAWLSSSLVNKLIAFNANFKGIKKELVETTNPKLLSLDFLKNYLEKYFEDMDISYGRKFGKTEQGGTPAPATIDELTEYLPDIGMLSSVRDNFNEFYGKSVEYKETERHNLFNAEREIDDLELNGGDTEAVKLRIKLLQKRIIGIRQDYEEVVKLQSDIRKCQILLDFYKAVVPTQETLNLIKQSLTQQERGDLIRRYMIVLRQLKILTNSGIDEIEDESNKLDLDNYEALRRFTGKVLKSLSFLTNDSGVNQLTKLQRDYELLLEQNGKVVDIDRIKRLNDVRDAEVSKYRQDIQNTFIIDENEIADLRANLKANIPRDPIARADADRNDEKIAELVIAYENADNDGERRYIESLITKLRAEYGTVEDRAKAEQLESTARHSGFLGSIGAVKKGLKKTGIATAEPIMSEAELTQKMKEFQTAKVAEEAGLVAERRQVIKNYYEQFYGELNGLYQNDKKRISDGLYNYINTRFQGITPDIDPKYGGETLASYWSRLTEGLKERVELFLDSRTPVQIQSMNPVASRIPMDYRVKHGAQELNRETTYGIGVKEKLRKHFNEDKKYLTKQAEQAKDIKKMLSNHILETEPIERRIAETLGGELKFKHTRIKVGRGITATEQPQYKTFGKYVIHYGHLIDRNIANFKYPSLGSIPAIKPVNITDDYKDFLIDTLNTGKANERALNKLSNDEKKHFERVIIGAGLLETFNLKRGYDGDEKKDSDRFILLRGEVMAGNNNDKLLKELRLLIIKLMSNGRIQRNEGTNMLIELSAI